MRRASKLAPSIADIARQAGVSTATVDRVLNDRGGVSAAKALRVNEALKALDASRSGDRETGHQLTIGMLIDSGSSFTGTLKALAHQSNQTDKSICFQLHSTLTNQFDAGAFSDKVLDWGEALDGIIIVSREHPAISRAIEALAEQGKGVVCLTTDQQNTRRISYAGMDQVASGLCAAHLIGRYGRQPQGDVLMLVSAPYRCQEERELGFRRLLRSAYPDLSVVELLNATDNSESSYHLLREALRRDDPPIAVYNMAGGNAGIARALHEAGLREEVLFVGHELNDTSRQLLESNAMDFVITHNLEAELLRAKCRLKTHHAHEEAQTPDRTPSHQLLKPVIKCKFNI
ncbi:LacI family DNA-binding transcriptional regulator [Cohaesibacter intestini]|uniref:LacI family DNA-binding transcriptional regulator n=1 Tax=Cohaesibacter intestini TaxID=2211145 RepID=UPI000DEBA7A8|nr:LacI family DNA-binding transcriptional regulator [Cohaesibacter intestini]